MNKRYHYFDNLKALLIFLVVFGHFIEPLIMESHFKSIYMFIYAFHMPLFAFISGYFSKKAGTKNLDNLLFKFIIYQILFAILFSSVSLYNNGYEIIKAINVENLTIFQAIGYILSPIWLLWYLISLISWRLLLLVFSKDKRYIILAFILGILIVFLPINEYVLSLQRTFGLFPFFLIGFYVSEKEIKEYLAIDNRIYMIVILMLTTYIFYQLTFYKMDYEYFYYLNNYLSLNINFVEGVFLRCLTYIYSLLLMAIVLLVVPERKTIFSYIGINSFSVYILHAVVYVILYSVGYFYTLQNTSFFFALLTSVLVSFITVMFLSNSLIIKYESKLCIDTFIKKDVDDKIKEK